MTDLADLLYRLAVALRECHEATASAGSATTITDTTNDEPDDYFAGGVIGMLSGLNAGKTREITTWVKSTGICTFPTMTALNAANDRYWMAPALFPRRRLVQAINQALRDCGDLLQAYTNVAFVTVADQEEYTLPAGVRDVRRLEIAQSTTAPYRYSKSLHWRPLAGSIRFIPGAQPKLAGYSIRLWHVAKHADLVGDDDLLDPQLSPDLVVWKAAAAVWSDLSGHSDDPRYAGKLAEAIAYSVREEQNRVKITMDRDPTLFFPGNGR